MRRITAKLAHFTNDASKYCKKTSWATYYVCNSDMISPEDPPTVNYTISASRPIIRNIELFNIRLGNPPNAHGGQTRRAHVDGPLQVITVSHTVLGNCAESRILHVAFTRPALTSHR